ncbi:hypothetical protein LDENG_00001830 [Lucifuga dentata]|nr:hypothetical protein LDENG_00001830 [Lucifuga dentata]
MREVGGEWPGWLVLTERLQYNSGKHSFPPWGAGKGLRTHKTNLEANGLQQQKTTLGSSPVSQEQKSEATAGTDSLKLDS